MYVVSSEEPPQPFHAWCPWLCLWLKYKNCPNSRHVHWSACLCVGHSQSLLHPSMCCLIPDHHSQTSHYGASSKLHWMSTDSSLGHCLNTQNCLVESLSRSVASLFRKIFPAWPAVVVTPLLRWNATPLQSYSHLERSSFPALKSSLQL